MSLQDVGNYTNALGNSVTLLGCYADYTSNRTLPYIVTPGTDGVNLDLLTPQICNSACYAAGSNYFGVEYSRECFCGRTLLSALYMGTSTVGGCNMSCTGNPAVNCGGSARINVYYTPLVAASASGPAASAGGYTDALGNTVTDLGCYIDDVLNRTMGNTPSANSGFIATAVTPQNCALACTKSGYGYAGLEYGVECYCSATAPATSLKAALNTQCNMACSGNAAYLCGGPSRMNVYRTAITATVVAITNVAGPSVGLTYAGCRTTPTAALSVPITSLTSAGSSFASKCAMYCATYGYTRSALSSPSGVNTCACFTTAWTGASVADTQCSNANAAPCEIYARESCGSQSGTYAVAYTAISSIAVPLPNYTTSNSVAFTYLGCFTDGVNNRILPVQVTSIPPASMTAGACMNACGALGYLYSGLEYGQECWCGMVAPATANLRTSATSNACTMQCQGDINQSCGSGNQIAVYSTSSFSTNIPGTLTQYTDPAGNPVKYAGCFIDAISSRIFPITVYSILPATMTPRLCQSACFSRGALLSGVEYAQECYCSNATAISLAALAAPASDCSMPCLGDSTLFCGSGNRLSVWSTTNTSAISTAYVIPSFTDVFGRSVQSIGCFVDSISNRVLSYKMLSIAGASMTPQACQAACSASGYTYSGVEYAVECYCSSSIPSNAIMMTDNSCDMPCSGNSLLLCGGGNRINIYQAQPVAASTTSPGIQTAYGDPSTGQQITYLGCFADSTDSRTMSISIDDFASNTTTPMTCSSACLSLGYQYSGTEYASECYCSNSVPTASAVADTGCNMPCSTGASLACGAGNRLSIYRSQPAVSTAVLLPLFLAPSTGAWQWVYDTVSANPLVQFRVIINPSNGPGASSPPSSDYQSSVAKLKSYSNVQTLGYVNVQLATRAYASSKNDVLLYSQWASAYSIQGLFFDNVPNANTATNEYKYMSDLVAYAKTVLGSSPYIIFNTGKPTGASFFSLANAISLWDGSLTDYQSSPPTVPFGIAPSQVAVMIRTGPNSVANQNALIDLLVGQRFFGHVWSTPGADYSSASALSNALAVRVGVNNGARTNSKWLSTAATIPGTVPTYINTTSSQQIAYRGCYEDDQSTRALPTYLGDFTKANTPQSCAARCFVAGYAYSGVEYAVECYCGNTAPTAFRARDSECSSPCPGNAALKCGSGERLSVYLSSKAPAAEIVVPLYVYPINGAWQFLYDAIAASPSITWRVIINPNSGPSTNPPSPDYVSALNTLKAYPNVKVIGYVRVGYATRAYADSQADVRTYSQWPSSIAMQGYFFDQAPNTNDAGQVKYMSDLATYARSLIANAYIIFNPGTDTLSNYWPLADAICIYEKSYHSYTTQPPVVPSGISSSKVVVMIYNAPDSVTMQNLMVDDMVSTRKFGGIYSTPLRDYVATPPLLTQLGRRTSLNILGS